MKNILLNQTQKFCIFIFQLLQTTLEYFDNSKLKIVYFIKLFITNKLLNQIKDYPSPSNSKAHQRLKSCNIMKLTKADVQKSIQQESINGQTIYYSYTNKQQATMSMFKNERLLIFNSNSGMLYYVNQPKQLPFKTEIPKPKNNTANINVSIVKCPPATSELNVQFAMKNDKNEQIAAEWNFVMENVGLAKEWLKVIQEYKNKKIQQITQAEDKSKEPTNINKNQKPNNTNNAFIHDTLGFGLLQAAKKQQPRIQPEIVSPERRGSDIRNTQPNLNQSRNAQNQPLKKPQNSSLRVPQNSSFVQPVLNSHLSKDKLSQSKFQNSPQKQPSPSIRESNVNIRESNTEQIQREKPKPVLEQSNIRRSNANNQNSPSIIRQSRHEDIGNSKITLRDQLESIMERSHLRQSKFESIALDKSNITDKNYKPENDWNLKFLKSQNEDVLLDFQIFARKAFITVLNEDQKAKQSIRVYLKPEAVVLVADARTIQAKRLKSEFRNYHFIMEASKYQFIVGVPLACLIQFEGLVALVKSTIPQGAIKLELTQQVMLDLKDLQRYTRIKNNVLKKASLYDLSDIYQSKGKRLVYINQLVEYLPVHIEQNYRGGSLRPEHLLDNVNQFMQGGMAHEANRQDMKILHETLDLIRVNIRELAKQLSTQDILFANCLQLKEVMHLRGINLKYLPILYNEVTNKNVKKYINTVMVAKVAKDDILQNLASLRIDSGKISMAETLQNSLRLLVEGNTNVSSQLWKQIAINFRKQYGIPMSNHDIMGPFFLNCLIKLIPGTYDLTKLNDKKTFFKDEGIIHQGFVVQILPKVKSFYRYTTQLTEKIVLTCRQQKLKQNFQAIVVQLQLGKVEIPRSFSLSKIDQNLKQYLSFYIPPSEFEKKQSYSHLKLFENSGIQPPTSLSLAVTKNYLDWCLHYEKFDIFKKILEETLGMIDFWFDKGHLYHCEFYESLANFYQMTGAIQESINFMKESLAICIRNGGVTSKKTGYKYYNLAQKELRAGRKNDSMDNFIKAKNNMQNYNDQTIKYPFTLMKLSSLYLNSSQFQNCIIFSKQAVQKFEQLQTKNKSEAIPKGHYDQYCIKAIEIMTRAFEIQNKKSEFYRVAQLASAKYNKTKNPQVFEQLIKICLTAVIFKHNMEKCQLFQSFLQKLNVANQNQDVPPQRCLDELMMLAEQFNVMERFMFKFESLQRIAADINSRRALSADGKEFVTVTKNVVGTIGEDYVYGLIQQKEFQ